MRRTIIVPANISEALDDLKSWLAITRPNEDELLSELLAASSAACDAFIGQSALEATVEERFPTAAEEYQLISRPINMIVSVEVLETNATRTPVGISDYEIEIDVGGVACLRHELTRNARAVIVTATTGISAIWAELPADLRRGIVGLAAHYYQDRDRSEEADVPPSVTALWQPWQKLRIA